MDETIKVCMVVYAYYPHDESRVQREAIALSEKGYQVDVICLKKRGEPICGKEDGVNFYRLPLERKKQPSLINYFFEYGIFFILVSLKLLTLFLEKRYKVIQFHTPPDILVFAGIIPKLMGAKVVLDIHDLMPELYTAKFESGMYHIFVRVLTFIERMACRFVDHVLVVTEIWRQRLIERGVTEKKCSVLMNLPDERIFKPIPQFILKKEHFNLIYHGTLVNRYGVDIAIRAVNILKNTIPKIKLNIIGDGEELESLMELVNNLSLEDKVYFSKKFLPVNAMPDIISRMDIGVVPNRLNNFTKDILNAKLLEYIAMGIPVIVARTPAIEYYFDETMVTFFTPGDEEELAQKITLLYNNPEERTKLVVNAKKFLELHKWEKDKDKYYSIIMELIQCA